MREKDRLRTAADQAKNDSKNSTKAKVIDSVTRKKEKSNESAKESDKLKPETAAAACAVEQTRIQATDADASAEYSVSSELCVI